MPEGTDCGRVLVLDGERPHDPLVKLIGDAAMFVADEPERACRIALDMVDKFEADPSVPPIRVALAYGTVVASNGDYYGDVVNLAARLVAAAEPGTAVATTEAVEGVPDVVAERLPARALKGFPPQLSPSGSPAASAPSGAGAVERVRQAVPGAAGGDGPSRVVLHERVEARRQLGGLGLRQL